MRHIGSGTLSVASGTQCLNPRKALHSSLTHLEFSTPFLPNQANNTSAYNHLRTTLRQTQNSPDASTITHATSNFSKRTQSRGAALPQNFAHRIEEQIHIRRTRMNMRREPHTLPPYRP